MRTARPLWGFGWAGWLLLPGAFALAWVFFTGFDLRFVLLKWTNDTLGSGAMAWFIGVVLATHYSALREPVLGPVTLCSVLVALHFHPRPMKRWRCGLIAWALLRPVLWFELVYWGRHLGAWWAGAPFAGLWADGWGTAIVTCFLAAADAMLLWLLTRSAFVTAPALAAGLGYACGVTALHKLGQFHWITELLHPLAMQAVWHGGVGAALLWWAIRAHRDVREPYQCQPCGYDLRGIADSQSCPECGAARVPSPP